MRSLLLYIPSLLLGLFLIHPTAVTAQATSTGSPPIALDSAFNRAVVEYQAFEKQHGHWLQTPNIRMHYLRFGDSQNIALIWAHGTFGNAYGFASIAEQIVQAGFFVIAIDYYGHGQTGYPKHEVSLYHVADDIRFLMDHLQIDQAVIGGLSRGGSIASAFYDAYPNRTKALVLEDGGSVSWVSEVHKLGFDKVKEKLSDFIPPAPPLFDSQLEAFTNYNKPADTSSKNWLINGLRQAPEGRWGYNPGLFQWLGEDSLEGALAGAFRPTTVPLFEASTTMMQPKIIYRNLHVPMLIFDPIDESDWMKDFLVANQKLQQQHPSLITHLVYKDTGHTVHFQRPKRFTKDLLSFLEKVKQRDN